MAKEITYNDIPQVLMEVNRKLDLLLAKQEQEPEQDRLMTVTGYRDYIEEKTGKRPACQTVYDQAFKRLVPYEKHGKFLYFRKSVIDSWLANGRQMA
jgi:hypothetical protein